MVAHGIKVALDVYGLPYDEAEWLKFTQLNKHGPKRADNTKQARERAASAKVKKEAGRRQWFDREALSAPWHGRRALLYNMAWPIQQPRAVSVYSPLYILYSKKSA